MRMFAKLLLLPIVALGLSSCASTMVTEENRTVYFDFGKSTLTSEAKAKLDNIATTLNDDSSVGAVNLVGYADHIGNEASNDALSKRRANAVKAYLSKKGWTYSAVGDTRWVGESQSTGCGEKASSETIACLSPDRKVEIQFVSKISDFCQHKFSRHCRQD
jgi:OOP family OmpA-OmpF porin